MKSITLALLAALTATAFAADTPADIAADYREKAAAALTKVNDTLEKAAVPLIAALVKTGDTAGADLLKEQLKAKLAGEPVDTPQPSAAALFKSYDAARAKALEPAQKSAISRIDAVLASSDGKKLDVVSELGKVRAEIEAGKAVQHEAITTMPLKWTYHLSEKGGPSGLWTFDAKGKYELQVFGLKNPMIGKWKANKNNPLLVSIIPNDAPPYDMTIQSTGETAVLDMPTVGKRYLKLAPAENNPKP